MKTPRILLFSTRGFRKWKLVGDQIEAEDVIAGIDDVKVLAPRARARGRSAMAQTLEKTLGHLSGIHLSFDPAIETLRTGGRHDLFFFRISNLNELAYLQAFPRWRERCAVAVCWIDELWARELTRNFTPRGIKLARHMRQLNQFDHVIVPFAGTLAPLAERLDCFVRRMPFAVDALRFCPWPNPPARRIDFFAMGRKSFITHAALKQYARAHDWLYLHDTHQVMDVYDPREHRSHLIDKIQMSRFFLANRAKVNAPTDSGGQQELGFRFFEGAAGGAVMIGELPDSPSFQECFDWPDAAFHLPFDSREIAPLLDELTADPERIERASRENVRQCLLRHDWSHRWRDILKLAGMEPEPQLANRMAQLERAASRIPRRAGVVRV